nr:MAG TPA: hypothetical protein [Caudoviricetes sp.]
MKLFHVIRREEEMTEGTMLTLSGYSSFNFF